MERHEGLRLSPLTLPAGASLEKPLPVKKPVCNTAPMPRHRWSGWDRETEDTFGKNQGNSPLALAQSSEHAREEVT